MSRVFAYCRVSTLDQNPENQRLEIEQAGFGIESRRIVEEKISGSVPAMERPEFARLVDRLEEGDILVVTKLDRLGRDAIDVRMTIKSLARVGVRVHCLALGNVDLTSPTGKMTMGVLSAVAEFERDLLVERTRAGLERAKAEGKKLGRRPCLSPKQCVAVQEALNEGQLPSQVAKDFQVSRQTIMRVREKMESLK
jgi:putative DNA-invertase from lambdoid prophage Rac